MLRRALGLLLCTAPLLAQSSVRGTVYDSLAHRPLVGATAQLFGPLDSPAPHGYSATTDSTGAYRLMGLATGRYAAGFFHVAVDSFGIELPTRTVEISAQEARIDFATPSTARLAALVCPDTPLTDSTGVIVGSVRESSTETPLARARVHVEWVEFGIDKNGTFSSNALRASSETTGPGWFAVCGVPALVPLTLRAEDGRDTTGYLNTQLESQGVRHMTFHIGRVVRTSSGAVAEGTLARVIGTITDDAGKPLLGAQVSLWQTNRGASTNDHGGFTLDDITAGSHTVEIRAIGATPVQRVVDLLPGETFDLNVAMHRAVALEAVRTRARVVYSRGLMEFQRHMRTAPGGYFVRPTEVGEHAGQDLVGLTRAAPNVVVTQDAQHKWQLLMVSPGAASITNGGLRTCTPPIFLNGRKSLMEFDDLVLAFPSDEILGLEVYNHLSQVPSDYQVDISSPCGAISLWTRPNDGSLRKLAPSPRPLPPPSPPGT